MDTLPESVRSTAHADQADVALLRAVAGMRPGWVVFRDCSLADDGWGARALVRYALFHPQIGIALLDVLPGAATPGAPHRVRRMLDAAGFRPAFGDYPPIVYLCVPSRRLSDIAPLLARNFGTLPPLALPGGDAWVAAAQTALAAPEPPPRASGPPADAILSEPIAWPPPERTESRSMPRPPSGFARLGVFWGAVAVAFGSGALVLQHLGPPAPPAVSAHARPRPEKGPIVSEEARLAPTLPEAARPSSAGPLLALWPAEPMRTWFDGALLGSAATLVSGDMATAGLRSDGDRPAPTDIMTPVEPPWSQAAAAGPDMTAGANATQAAGFATDDGTPAPVSRLHADAAAKDGRDDGFAAPPAPDLAGAVAPAQGSIPTAFPDGASEDAAAADAQDSPHADPRSARGPEGFGTVDVGPPATTETGAGADASPLSEAASAPAQEDGHALGPPAADTRAPTAPPAIPAAHAEPAPVPPADIAASSATAATGVAATAAGAQPPRSPAASPAAVAALLARGDALIAIGDVAAARLVYQRAAAHASARAATATGKTYDPLFLQAIGAIGVIADPDAAAAWYRRASALGDDDAASRLNGSEAKASR